MKTNVLNITKEVSPYDIPVGRYRGLWSGYQVTAHINGSLYHLRVDNGVRGIDIPCWIIFDPRSVTVETISE